MTMTMTATATTEAGLRAAGLRVTAGRVALIKALGDRPHSHAETLHLAMPEMSIQSVHNVLSDLTAAGIIRRIEPAGSPARYELRIGDNHHHLVCTSCAVVSDVDCVIGEAPCLTPSDDAGFLVESAEVTFWGLCANCQAAADIRR